MIADSREPARWHRAFFIPGFALILALAAGLALAGAAPRAAASGLAQAVTATPIAAGGTAPAPVDTANAPLPVNTGGPQAPVVVTGGPSPLGNGQGANPASVPPGGPAAGTTSGTGSQTSVVPWLVGAVILLGLIGLGAFALRRNVRAGSPVPQVEGATVQGGSSVPVEGAATVPLSGSFVPQVGGASALVAAPAAEAVRCPNCDTLNSPDRRFCDECGQDLRPAQAAVAGPPVPVVDEASTPYLETLSRVDEQLEFVLARSAVAIGRALDNDIVVDEQFAGWQTVSPHHARLTQQPDGFLVEDLDSENGTFVNGARTGHNLLEDGQTVALGQVEFVYHVPSA